MLKNLLALLLAKFYSKEESGLVARQAMPSDQPVNIASKTTISSWGTIATFTAPGDGYVTFHGRSMAGAAAQIASLPLENNPTVITATQDNYQGMACNLPVQKGKTVEIYGSNIENIVVTFNRLIGGYNRNTFFSFGKGEKLCLKPLSNFSQKVSSRANQIGLAAKFFRSQESLSTLPLKRTQRRAMGGLSSGDFLPTFWRLMSQAEDLCSYPVLCRNTKAKGLQFLFISRSLRDRKSTCWETKPQTFCNVGLLQPLALRNLLSTGGKLC
jgi:hypothetical protein